MRTKYAGLRDLVFPKVYGDQATPTPYTGDVLDKPFAQSVALTDVPTADPIVAGFRLGMLGAAAGLGYSGVRRKIKGKEAYRFSVRPMLIGAALGATIGVAGTAAYRPRVPSYKYNTWRDVMDRSNQRMQTFIPQAPLNLDKSGGMQKGAALISGTLAAAFALMSLHSAWRAGKHGHHALQGRGQR